MDTIDQLTINSPYEEPSLYWSYDRKTRTFSRKAGRRPAGYVIASESSRAFDELCDPERTLHIDSKVLDMAEALDEPVAEVVGASAPDDEGEEEIVRKLSKKEQAELLRRTVDTVGRVGDPGEKIQKVISVGMLSEGWDAKTVTHIMGLRAFSSQLLCEQVVGRGLRRTSYEINKDTGLFESEYVNIFGVPFTFLPHESTDGPPPPPPSPKREVKPLQEKRRFEVSWPNIIRIDHVYKPVLTLDLNEIKSLVLNAYDTATLAELAPVVEGKPDVTKISSIGLESLAKQFRMQKIIFESARDVFDQMKPSWKGNREYLLAQLIQLVEKVLASSIIQIEPPLFNQDDTRRRILLTLNMSKIVQHIWEAIRFKNSEAIVPIFDTDNPIRSTGDMRPWYTGKPCEPTNKSHVNLCVFDSTWEASEMFELERNSNINAWVKNDHLGFEILYMFNGVVKKYRPDFIIRLKTGSHLVLETKGQDTQQDTTKRSFLAEWIDAVNAHGGFGKWSWAVSKNPADIKAIIENSVNTVRV